MSLFSWFGGEDSDADVGNEVLKAYFYEASKFPEFSYANYEDWIIWVTTRVPDYVELIGQLVKSNKASTSITGAIGRVMELANLTGGQASLPNIVAAAGGKGESINWAVAIPEVASESVETLTTTAQDIGEGLLSTGKTLKYLPWILGIGAGLYIFTLAKSQGRTIGSLLKKNPNRYRKC